MEWGVLFGGAAFGLSLVLAIAGLMYLIMRLMVAPMATSIRQLEIDVSEIKEKVKTEGDLLRMIDVRIAEHERRCREGKSGNTGRFRKLNDGTYEVEEP
jgi:hypothetical protein